MTQESGTGLYQKILSEKSIVDRLRNWCTDWNGAPMNPGEPPRDGLHCDDLISAAAEIERLTAELKTARNTAKINLAAYKSLAAERDSLRKEAEEWRACARYDPRA
jgi:hypothetical protein